LRRNYTLKHVIVGITSDAKTRKKIEQLLDDLKEMREYGKLKAQSLYRIL
jgi:hypothetical protein